MTDKFDPARLRELHEAATPGPWVSIGTDPAEGGDWFWIKAPPSPLMRGFTHEIGVMNGSQSDPVRQANAALIAALRNAAPALLAMADENAALKAEVARLRDALEEILNLPGEINPSNYDHDDACELNRQFCYSVTVARAALAGGGHD